MPKFMALHILVCNTYWKALSNVQASNCEPLKIVDYDSYRYMYACPWKVVYNKQITTWNCLRSDYTRTYKAIVAWYFQQLAITI